MSCEVGLKIGGRFAGLAMIATVQDEVGSDGRDLLVEVCTLKLWNGIRDDVSRNSVVRMPRFCRWGRATRLF